jgi:hypothetical protein
MQSASASQLRCLSGLHRTFSGLHVLSRRACRQSFRALAAQKAVRESQKDKLASPAAPVRDGDGDHVVIFPAIQKAASATESSQLVLGAASIHQFLLTGERQDRNGCLQTLRTEPSPS